MKKTKEYIDLSLNWQIAMKYLLVLIESHANKSFLEQDSEGVSPRDTIRELLQNCAQVADLYVDHTKKCSDLPEGYTYTIKESEVK